jgi:molybdopterin-containing oxidoreductase family iron-sulfur binding subunit
MVVARPLGTVEKCTMCVQRLAEGQVPSCVWSCPAQARVFGDLNDPSSPIQHLVNAPGVGLLRPELGTSPRVYYVGLETEVG